MSIKEALHKYKSLYDDHAFGNSQNNTVASEFKETNPTLLEYQFLELVDIIKHSTNKMDLEFVAELIYVYESFDEELLHPLLKKTLNSLDPTFNNILLRLCIRAFGEKKVTDSLLNLTKSK